MSFIGMIQYGCSLKKHIVHAILKEMHLNSVKSRFSLMLNNKTELMGNYLSCGILCICTTSAAQPAKDLGSIAAEMRYAAKQGLLDDIIPAILIRYRKRKYAQTYLADHEHGDWLCRGFR